MNRKIGSTEAHVGMQEMLRVRLAHVVDRWWEAAEARWNHAGAYTCKRCSGRCMWSIAVGGSEVGVHCRRRKAVKYGAAGPDIDRVPAVEAGT